MKKSRDAKPEAGASPFDQRPPGSMSYRERESIRRKRLLAMRHAEDTSSGDFTLADHSPGGRKSGVVFGVTGKQGGLSAQSPTLQLAWRIRNALSPNQHKRSDCIVYDAAGKPIAILDGESRERRPL